MATVAIDIFSAQFAQKFVKDVEESLTAIELAYIRQVNIEANSYQLESIFKNWLHDCGTDSDHLRLTIDKMVLRCDIKECLLNADSLPTTLSSSFSKFESPSADCKSESFIKATLHHQGSSLHHGSCLCCSKRGIV
ncbi:uncharacterized protein CEXT_304781 [Caerostris extrusa]|uniref:BACK domain-containing protein n=1 Tax=Caerostris extrusa TaxID=172846 RepID=A0AAV4RXW8_CAEEX|nr:uncharacterized protein CEXT_304781 [Caerostris extrusa]